MSDEKKLYTQMPEGMREAPELGSGEADPSKIGADETAVNFGAIVRLMMEVARSEVVEHDAEDVFNDKVMESVNRFVVHGAGATITDDEKEKIVNSMSRTAIWAYHIRMAQMYAPESMSKSKFQALFQATLDAYQISDEQRAMIFGDCMSMVVQRMEENEREGRGMTALRLGTVGSDGEMGAGHIRIDPSAPNAEEQIEDFIEMLERKLRQQLDIARQETPPSTLN